MSTPDLLLAFTCPLLQVIILLRLFRDGHAHKVPLFVIYLSALTARFFFLMTAYFLCDDYQYFTLAWMLKPVEYLMGIGLAISLIASTFRQNREVAWFYAAAGAVAMLAIMSVEFEFVPMMQALVAYDLLRVYLLVMVFIFGSTWKYPHRQVAVGFGVAALADLGCTFMKLWAGAGHCLAIQRAYQCGFICALLVWLWGLLKGETKSKAERQLDEYMEQLFT